MTTTIHAIDDMPREAMIDADIISVYQLTKGPQAGMSVVEILDAHQSVIARSIIDAPGTREQAADAALKRSGIERCGRWGVHPIGRGKRSVAMVILRTSNRLGTLDAIRSIHQLSA